MSEDRGDLGTIATGAPATETRWTKLVDKLKALKPHTREKPFQLPQPDKGEEWKFGAAFSVLGRIGYQNIDGLKSVFSESDTNREYRHQQELGSPYEQASLGKE